ncbi:hypothetical protein OB986_17995 [Bacillus cereus]|uniref:hypothetical protein n=1 Tax=Bacillus cereus group TaxID=86661 RepID=UPI0015C4EDC7|nr:MULTISPECIES: hypothetical protein [Bacillus cereus group]MCU5063145.1 hypothetical protein [Bacillus cereus]MEB8692944.1 hypothetical protein [Bacillus cereus]
MSLQNKMQAEIQILINIIERERENSDKYTAASLVAYEYGLQALMEVYEASKKLEVAPF